MTLEEINKLPIKDRITELKKRPTPLPDASALLNDWDADRHDVMINEKGKRPKRKITIEPEERDLNGNTTRQARYEYVEVNRISMPLEQDIVNTQTAFTVGNKPKLICETEDEKELNVLSIVRKILRQNKIKYQNKRIMRSWLSEQEVAEYWYTVEDDVWWKRLLQKLFKNTGLFPKRKLKSVLWSPFRGDKLYPYFDEFGDLKAFSREYKIKVNDEDVTRFMVIDDKNVTIYQDDERIEQFAHGFPKMPIMYIYRDKPYCHKIKTIRNRIEMLLSNFADCLDYNFFPKLTAKGLVEDVINRGTGSEIIQLENGAEIAYLTWQQSPEMAKMELETLFERAYSLTNTVRTSVEYLKGVGAAVSGRAFRYVFMGAHMQVSNHAEDLEEFLQRRVNFLVSAIGALYPTMKDTCDVIDIETEIVPFMIDNRTEEINDAVTAYGGGVASRKQGIILAGITDAVNDELKMIEDEKKEKED